MSIRGLFVVSVCAVAFAVLLAAMDDPSRALVMMFGGGALFGKAYGVHEERARIRRKE